MTLVTAKPVNRRKPVYYNGLDRLFDDFFRFDVPAAAKGKTHPAVNILEGEQDFQLEFLVPGWEKTDFNIQVEKNILTVAAELKQAEGDQETKEAKPTYRRREFGKNNFKRSFEIPETVNAEAIDAKYANGILTLTLPKREEAEAEVARTIEIG
ncbi:Hsp20/alpha crystallin family protein [Flavilitoribacter nigricans]|uniref:SHSP domain-containing protein n=1 Tax=Flavilitoribacter nigricans (strain ATCC 23147 / DSM 23189 / NBRC 102662 / NCIMB 1420 / SS-2) TaxID=1122177 RepID=A0A2D0N855_FLAN2|nr:Hsp20/alpha crystallin family protein [Flavilitoribacter nigricans]PHN04692.1 hypothetical protein CRP01_19440 [Flavilitoribacter nigricans DSM 23189 = NBRC 102662]